MTFPSLTMEGLIKLVVLQVEGRLYVKVIRVSWIVIVLPRNLSLLDFLLLIFKCVIILVGYPLVVISVSNFADQSEEQREARRLPISVLRCLFTELSWSLIRPSFRPT